MKHTEEQKNILQAAKGSDSVLINALAGSGKTTTLVDAVGQLPQNKTLAIAFNTRIKKEMEKKLPNWVICKTFNGLGHGAWSTYLRKRLLLEQRKMFQILKEEYPKDWERDLFGDLLQALGDAKLLGLVPHTLTNYPSKSFLSDTEESWEKILCEYSIDFTPDLLSILRACLVESIRQAYQGVIDFNDQIYMPLCFSAAFPKFDTILVDEAQDISPMNLRQLLACKASRALIFGDRHQSIYAFRGADPKAMDSLAEHFSAIELPLNTTFRCPRTVVKVCLWHVPSFRAHESCPEGEVKLLKSWGLEDIPAGAAVLCRNNAPLLSLASKMLQQGIIPNVLGKGIGKGLLRILQKLPQTIPPRRAVSLWAEKELQKGTAGRKKKIADQQDCLLALLDASPTASLADLSKTIMEIFDNPAGMITLSTGHKAKGLEWNVVFHLDSHLIKAEKDTQEANLLYVINTRAKKKLTFVDSKNLAWEPS